MTAAELAALIFELNAQVLPASGLDFTLGLAVGRATGRFHHHANAMDERAVKQDDSPFHSQAHDALNLARVGAWPSLAGHGADGGEDLGFGKFTSKGARGDASKAQKPLLFAIDSLTIKLESSQMHFVSHLLKAALLAVWKTRTLWNSRI
jgi:hypothetical protein